MEIQKVATHRIVGLVILALVLTSLVMSWLATFSLRAYVDCQADWSTAYANGVAQRAQAAADDRAALDQLVASVAEATSGAETRTALARYRAARAAADEARAVNPPPEAPPACH